ncbi:MAG: hypothetical protein H7Z41_15615 [Cytophagales bacterium]|nr:hypothetical protein [Armatimonadota bacterium]
MIEAQPSTPEGSKASVETLSPASAPEAKPRRRFPLIGPEVGSIYPLDAKTRDRFGSALFSFSPGSGLPA